MILGLRACAHAFSLFFRFIPVFSTLQGSLDIEIAMFKVLDQKGDFQPHQTHIAKDGHIGARPWRASLAALFLLCWPKKQA